MIRPKHFGAHPKLHKIWVHFIGIHGYQILTEK